ncbi:hypothetical protein [Rhodococcus sp. Leaf233]|uniref:hypothetical protein n=1 Tax=Rhodococcus sp. Leaf233 TaxID=1736302 RepID=UPI00070FDB98|nr:hypothetical protein [Rhodococcus sp. Leaf233]KQU33564.1 hypothetical protein ASH04_06950 [Rhodococcus sp. Leaf233]
MSEAIAFPDVEALVVSKLRSELASRDDVAHVSTRMLNPRTKRSVRVFRSGGRRRDLVVDTAQITIQCWDITAPEASALSRLCRAVLSVNRGAWRHDGVQVYHYDEVGGPVFFPDPDTNLPRYQFTCSLDVRGEAI